MNARFAGRAYVVTGSTSGIGEAVARRLAMDGGLVVVHGLDAEAGERVVAEIGNQAVLCLGDVCDPAVPTRVVDACLSAFGRIDGLVNNAGISDRTDLLSTTAESFDRIMATNARGPLLFVQAAWPHFRALGKGRVVNIGSVNAYCGGDCLLAYSMSKGALMTMTRNLSVAHAREGLRINQLNIGWTRTQNEYRLAKEEGLPENWDTDVASGWLPFGRLFEPEDIANAVAFLLSDEAELLNGSVIEYDQWTHIGRF